LRSGGCGDREAQQNCEEEMMGGEGRAPSRSTLLHGSPLVIIPPLSLARATHRRSGGVTRIVTNFDRLE